MQRGEPITLQFHAKPWQMNTARHFFLCHVLVCAFMIASKSDGCRLRSLVARRSASPLTSPAKQRLNP